MKKFFLCFLAPLFAISCVLETGQNTDSDLTGTWRLYDAEPTPGESGKHSFSEQAGLKQAVKEGGLLCFFEDGSYAELKGENGYETGRFEYGKNKHSLRFITKGEDATSIEINVEATEKNRKRVLSLQNKEHGVVLKFLKTANAPSDFREAPFYPGNNLWRVKPKAPEDSSQKMARLTAYIKHVALILKAAKEEKQAVVSFEFSAGPIKIYNGGIGIHPFGLVPESWKNSFYNEADAYSAYEIYQSYLQKNSFRGAGTGDWVEDDYTILLSIYADLQQAAPGNKP